VSIDEQRRLEVEARLIEGAWKLGLDPTARDALLSGIAVARTRLDPEVLGAIGEPLEGEPLELSEQLALRILAVRPPAGASGSVDAATSTAQVVSLDEFVAIHEPGAAPILGTADGTLIPEGGDAMVYGDGGVGKTTLAVDLAFHLAAGDDWLGIPVVRPARLLLIENEGPRPLFRRKLERKRDAWTGSELGDRLLVLEEPWGQFTFAETGWRQLLAATTREREVDVVIVGPLTASGMEAAGTLQDVREFLNLVDQTRTLAGRRFANVLVHHENRGGKVSGAWEGAGDTLLHVLQQGHGRLRLYIQKARWSSDQHATTLQLAWAAGDGFVSEDEPPRPERVWDDIATFVLEHGGCAWNKVDAAVPGQRDYLTRRRDQMLAEGLIINAGRGQRFELWHRDDPARPTLDTTGSGAGTSREPTDSDPGGGTESQTGSPVPLRSREPVSGEPPPAEPGEPNRRHRSMTDAGEAGGKEDA
jgi:hypothetical protein